jgi:hypothetical protein
MFIVICDLLVVKAHIRPRHSIHTRMSILKPNHLMPQQKPAWTKSICSCPGLCAKMSTVCLSSPSPASGQRRAGACTLARSLGSQLVLT